MVYKRNVVTALVDRAITMTDPKDRPKSLKKSEKSCQRMDTHRNLHGKSYRIEHQGSIMREFHPKANILGG